MLTIGPAGVPGEKDKHISPPASSCGGEVLPMSSLILMLVGRSVFKAAFGCKLMMTEPRVGAGMVGEVRPETVEASLEGLKPEAALEEPDVKEPVVTVPGRDALELELADAL